MKLKICLLILAILLSIDIFTMQKNDPEDETSDTSDFASSGDERTYYGLSDDDTSYESFSDDERDDLQFLSAVNKSHTALTKFNDKQRIAAKKRRQKINGRFEKLKNKKKEPNYYLQNLHNRNQTLIAQTKDFISGIEKNNSSDRENNLVPKKSTKPDIKQVTIIAGALISFIAASYYFIKKFWFTEDKADRNDSHKNSTENLKK